MQRDHMVFAVLFVVAAFGFLFLSVRHNTVADDGNDGLKLLSANQVQSAPDWALTDAASGKTIHLSQEVRRQPVVFSFWATWCGPCREELPHLESVARKYQGRIAFFGVNSSDAPPAINAFAHENGLTFPMLSDLKRDAATRYGAESIPMMVVVDTRDKVRAVSVGYDPDGDLEASLSKVLDSLLTEKPL
jgi:thiol-disulfide isomerase/thioredoxin